MFRVIDFSYLAATSLEQLLNEQFSGWIVCGMNDKFIILTRPVWTYTPVYPGTNYTVTYNLDGTIQYVEN